MSRAKKFHLSDDGPRVCKARFRSCKYGESSHGTEEEMTRAWEAQQEASFSQSLLAGASKLKSVSSIADYINSIDAGGEATSSDSANSLQTDSSRNKNRYGLPDMSKESPEEVRARMRRQLEAEKLLSDPEVYGEVKPEIVRWAADREIAAKLALATMSELSHTPVEREDAEWATNGMTHVRRYGLEDGAVGYFKSLPRNGLDESSFRAYGTSSLGAAINEVNSYRTAQLFGGEYAKLVPETVLREIDGEVGTFQREVRIAKYEDVIKVDYEDENSRLAADYRKAAIFDFVTGSLDRHARNFLYEDAGPSAPQQRRIGIKLIDNSFSFPGDRALEALNATQFADNRSLQRLDSEKPGYSMPKESLNLTSEELATIERVGNGVATWVADGTISETQAKGVAARVKCLLTTQRIVSFSNQYYRMPNDWRQ